MGRVSPVAVFRAKLLVVEVLRVARSGLISRDSISRSMSLKRRRYFDSFFPEMTQLCSALVSDLAVRYEWRLERRTRPHHICERVDLSAGSIFAPPPPCPRAMADSVEFFPSSCVNTTGELVYLADLASASALAVTQLGCRSNSCLKEAVQWETTRRSIEIKAQPGIQCSENCSGK